jgi:hypothetical protein
MKKFTLLFVFYLAFIGLRAQTPSWSWVKTDTNAAIGINPGYLMQVIAATPGGHSVWGVLQNKKMTYSPAALGDYKITEYNSDGSVVNSAALTGNFYLMQAEADNNGNWYFLGQYFDTVSFPGGTQFTRSSISTEPDYFIFKLNKGTLSLAWAKHIGANNDNAAVTFTIGNNSIYIPVDSIGEAVHILKMDIATGNYSTIIDQGGQSTVSSIQVDDAGNIYLAGSCAFTQQDFNGHIANGISGYPVYIVKYGADGQYRWSLFMSDVTCNPRKLTMVNNNFIYYSGAVHDTFSLGGYNLHHPAWVYDFFVSRLDSNGNVSWLRQLKDTISGDANAEYPYHAAVTSEGSINVFAETRKTIDWGNGVVLNNPGYNSFGTIINFAPDGKAQWVKTIDGDFASTEHIISNGNDLWITGNGRDSTDMKFGTISAPVALGAFGYTPYFAKLSLADTATGINIIPAEDNVNVYPNPANEVVNIANSNPGKSTVQITDLTGRIVYNQSYQTSGKIAINVASFSRGLYFIELKTDKRTIVKKLVLQ